jgi:hypothetical protein
MWMAPRARTTHKSGKQLEAEIASALARHRVASHVAKPTRPSVPLRKALSEGNERLISIVQLVNPLYKPPAASVMVEIADHVDRPWESSFSHTTRPTRNDALVWLYGSYAVKSILPHDKEVVRSEIPLGAAYVVIRRGESGRTYGSTIYLPPLESSTIDVAVDAVIETDSISPEVVDMIGHALQGSGGHNGLLRATYIAAIARIANRRIQRQARAPVA